MGWPRHWGGASGRPLSRGRSSKAVTQGVFRGCDGNVASVFPVTVWSPRLGSDGDEAGVSLLPASLATEGHCPAGTGVTLVTENSFPGSLQGPSGLVCFQWPQLLGVRATATVLFCFWAQGDFAGLLALLATCPHALHSHTSTCHSFPGHCPPQDSQADRVPWGGLAWQPRGPGEFGKAPESLNWEEWFALLLVREWTLTHPLLPGF